MPTTFTPSQARKRSVMLKAWTIAREGAARFGGSARQYLGEALRLAWRDARLAAVVADVKASRAEVGNSHFGGTARASLSPALMAAAGRRRARLGSYCANHW